MSLIRIRAKEQTKETVGHSTGAPQEPQNFAPGFSGFPHVVQNAPAEGPAGGEGGAEGGAAGAEVFVKS
jgi:hypothetical protein